MDYVFQILRARVYDVARESPLDFAPRLSARLNNSLFLKREDLQDVFSFKLRGAYNKLVQAKPEQLKNGVVAASAGNHAQGVALSAKRLGAKATIVMPKTTPDTKIQAVKARGAKAVLFGDSFDEAYAHALALSQEQKALFVHPFDDSDVIAGQGTIGMEMLRQHPDALDAIFVPVGGGGLISGIASYVKYVRPEIKIIAVEPQDAPTLHNALKAGEPVDLAQVGLFADGVAVKRIGDKTFSLCKALVDETVLVSSDEICAAVKDIFDDTRVLAEPAGALGVAGVKRYVNEHKLTGQAFATIVSGANTNFDRLRHIAERAELGEQREGLFAVQIPEKPGSFLKFCKMLGKRSITEFNYRYSDKAAAQVFCGVQLADKAERIQLIETWQKAGYQVVDLTENETAKLHIRYMVGGHVSGIDNESLFRFEFPERPGALLAFLSGMSRGWNISLFHYRNHGAAYGRVLMGIQLDSKDKSAFLDFLAENSYAFWEETTNPAYQLFAGTA